MAPVAHERTGTWSLLRHLKREQSFPWIVGVDFNEIIYLFENKGGIPREEGRIEAFRNALGDYDLIDIGYLGV